MLLTAEPSFQPQSPVCLVICLFFCFVFLFKPNPFVFCLFVFLTGELSLFACKIVIEKGFLFPIVLLVAVLVSLTVGIYFPLILLVVRVAGLLC